MSKNKQAQEIQQTKPKIIKPPEQNKQTGTTAVTNPIPALHRAYADPRTLSAVDAQTLQRTIGNQALGRLTIQRKMTVGPVGDKYEQEADSIASQVVQQINTSTPQTTQRQGEEEEIAQMKPLATSISSVQRQEEEELQAKPIQRQEEEELQAKPIQRQEEEELQAKPIQRQEEEVLQAKPIQRQEEEELQAKPIQRQEEEELQAKPIQRQEEEELQMKSTSANGGPVSAPIEQDIESAKGGGAVMAEGVRHNMERSFGADFSGVKIHTDSQAHTLNRTLSARAFTTGQDIFFRQGEYNPGSHSGQELIAHELTHVVQQNGTAVQPKSDNAV